MAFEHYYAQEWKSIQGVATDSENTNACFDCNICLDFAKEPVVTLCGHLYCWSCIYKWLHVQSATLAPDEHPQCPVCKADISHTTMVPLYGRGQILNEAEDEGKAPLRSMVIPPRPAACGVQSLLSAMHNTGQQLPYRNPYQSQQFDSNPYGSHEEHSTSPWLNLGGTSTGFQHPVAGMFGEMVYARVFGNSANLYTYPNSYQLMGRSSPRLRRQEMQANKSLNRISFFLFCCLLLCLIVF
ncbi:E3 ubiquitin-protein ligase RMA1H1-like [Juglans microcarpa x Juglans regia]|uniref:E3 ubiquitin-protein ligase RMA1H1-like n=1 Tax=Juglans microcarpa x Juglans regia TaxID=2249226 RepID=UPI001B7E2864|nr:E3 ubiquitin-protein ligase RMA1H1-like [Juglans microcarpa x Juglans regia]XP_041026076.1 E3 ubiquitin-protein ligase RMA1H1-like [Juglans microcarpa x Juglans regia]